MARRLGYRAPSASTGQVGQTPVVGPAPATTQPASGPSVAAKLTAIQYLPRPITSVFGLSSMYLYIFISIFCAPYRNVGKSQCDIYLSIYLSRDRARVWYTTERIIDSESEYVLAFDVREAEIIARELTPPGAVV